MRRFRPVAACCFLALVALLSTAGATRAASADEKVRTPKPLPGKIDIVLALDSSGSMRGLYHSARDKFWAVVTEISRARPEPDLRVGLITFGGTQSPFTRNIVVASNLTYDFDDVARKIDETDIEGGEEYVGGAVHTAIGKMTWRPGALKIVFVAGNESADQDRTHRALEVAQQARDKGIHLNAIYCGNPDDTLAKGWRELAQAGAGTFASIDQDRGTVHVASPFDKDLTRLSTKLNQTYRFFGVGHRRRTMAQEKSDDRAADAGAPVAAERAAAKATRQYGKAGDLIRASEAPDFEWSKLEQKDLPKDLQGLSPADLEARVEALRKDRARIEAEIQALAKKRAAHVAKERARRALGDDKALDRVLRDAIRKQAEAAGFRFPAVK